MDIIMLDSYFQNGCRQCHQKVKQKHQRLAPNRQTLYKQSVLQIQSFSVRYIDIFFKQYETSSSTVYSRVKGIWTEKCNHVLFSKLKYSSRLHWWSWKFLHCIEKNECLILKMICINHLMVKKFILTVK